MSFNMYRKSFTIIISLMLFHLVSLAGEEKRLALVIGNSQYSSGELKNAVNDANEVSTKLKTLGFDVILKNNVTNQMMGEAINDFTNKASSYDVALFYYAGHGIQSEGSNYLIPVNDNLIEKESDIEYNSQNVNRILRRLEDSGCKLKIIILDACRNNPFERSWHRSAASKGLAFLTAPDGTLIAYATSPGSVADDGGNAQNSPYTTALLQTLDKTGLSIFEFFNEVGSIVRRNTKNKQTPWVSSSPIEGNFRFNQTVQIANEKSISSQKEYSSSSSAVATTGKINGHEWVDLGLSVKWATCNVGASSPSDYGMYYAWGQTSTECELWEFPKKPKRSIAGKSSYDAARANWGGTWRIPTVDEFEELVKECTWTWTTQDGHNGYRVTGKNGKSIFLPAAGGFNFYGGDASVRGSGEHGYYWSATRNKKYILLAYYLSFDNGYYDWDYFINRILSFTIRPVTE